MSADLQGRVALVTGGARGVGREVALGLAEAGADVALIDRCATPGTTPYPGASSEDLQETQAIVQALGRRCLAVQADVTDLPGMTAAVDRAVQQLGRLDIVVANAGIFTWGRLWELTEHQWDETIAVNLKGVWITLKATVPHLIAQRSGRIVCVSSTAGLRGCPNISHYAASKHGVIGLARSLAMEVGGFGVTVNAVCPSRMKTRMVAFPEYYEAFAGPGATEEDSTASRAASRCCRSMPCRSRRCVRPSCGWHPTRRSGSRARRCRSMPGRRSSSVRRHNYDMRRHT